VYGKKADVGITIKGVNGAKWKILNDGTGVIQDGTYRTVPIGTVLQLEAADSSKVQYWLNESNNVLSSTSKATYTVTRATTITLVYKLSERENDSTYVHFTSSYGQTLAYDRYSGYENKVYFPTPPTRTGYKFLNWKFVDTGQNAGSDIMDNGAAILARCREGAVELELEPDYQYVGSTSGITKSQYVIRYTDKAHVNLTDDMTSIESQTVNYGVGVTYLLKSDTPGGNKKMEFDHWEDSNGTILGYGKVLAFTAVKEQAVFYAVYINTDVDSHSSAVPMVYQDNPIPVKEDTTEGTVYKVKGLAGVSVPEGYTLIDYGFVWAFNHTDISTSTIVIGGKDIGEPYEVKANNWAKTNGGAVCRYNKKVLDDVTKKVTLRGYAHVENNTTHQTEVYYSNIITKSYNDLV
jgi:hypothetical protein